MRTAAQLRPSVPAIGSMSRTLLLLTVANVLLAVVLFALRSPRTSPPEPVVLPTLPPQVQQLRARIAEGHAGEPYSLSLTDDELSATANYFLGAAPDVPFTGIRVAVADERVTADAVTRGLAVTVPVRIVGTVSAAGGLPRARIEDVSLGGTPLPAFVRDQIVREANASLDFSRYRMPLTVDALETAPGRLTIRGTLKERGT